MAGKVWTQKEDNLVKTHYLTHSSHDIAKMLPSRTKRSIDHRIETLGLARQRSKAYYSRRKGQFDQGISEKLGEPLESYLRRRYIEEQATYRELCSELNINNRTLMRRMKMYDIEPIDPITAGQRNYQKHQPIYHNNLTVYKNEDKARIKTSQTIQENWTKFISEPALNILARLQAIGLDPIPEYSIYRYNIDLAFVDQKLAVEIDGGNWHSSPRKQRPDKKKNEFLAAQGWTVLRIGTPTSFPPVPVSKAVTIISSTLKSLASTQPL